MNVRIAPLISCAALTDEVECYALAFLLQCRFQCRRVDKYWLIITVDESRRIDRNSKISELVSKAPQVFHCLIHCHELTPKRGIIHCSFLLGITVHRIIVQNYNEAIPRLPRQRLSCMVSVHKATNCESISKWLIHVGWKGLSDLFARRGIYQVSPILAMKGIHVYVWFTHIKHHIIIHVFLDICEDMEECLKVPLSW